MHMQISPPISPANAAQIDPDSLVNHAGERRERELQGEGEEDEGMDASGEALEKRQRCV